MSYTYVLKNKLEGMSLESYVSGRYRMNFIRRPVFEEQEDKVPEMYKQQHLTFIDMKK